MTDLSQVTWQGEVQEARRYVELANKLLVAAVVNARNEQGATWQQLGDILGVTHQGARSRWAKVCKEANGK